MPLTLEKETMEMEWKERAGAQTGQILLEGDMIVPDSKPDLQEILRCEGRVKIREKRIGDERISFSGELNITVLYRAKNGEKPLYAIESSLPLEDYLHMEGLEKDMEVNLTVAVEHLDCQIINDRKIGVKAVLMAKADAEHWKKQQVLLDAVGEGIEIQKKCLHPEQETVNLKDRFSVKEEVTIPASQPEIGGILSETLRLTDQEIRPMDGKAMVRGNLWLDLLYSDEEGMIGSISEKIPFHGHLEHGDIEPKTDLVGELKVEEYRLSPMEDEDGETRLLGLDVTIGAMLRGKEAKEQWVIQDAYGRRGTAVLQKEEITYPVTVANGKNQFVIRERIRLENGESPMLRAEQVWGEVQLSDVAVMKDAVMAEGVLLVDILYHQADDGKPMAMLHRGIPFSQAMELKGVSPNDEAEVQLRLEELDFQMLSETEGELRGTLTMDAAVGRQEKAEVVTDIRLEEDAETLSGAGAVIYQVQKGDSLWKIAKKYRTTVEDIVSVNEIEHPDLIYPGQKLLIIRMKC